ncbi:hypothetical protein I215_12393 [Galbibacter marinus]|uniref:Pectate lyase superfamily protein domain-containing protein n=1 Tax=Galbibacter marinus TaxID=555500 RepID=K2PSC5_9FLAO|nr:hypothetical protein [Galbibacter marinus]EKF54429.1 hypothetical protein I215_12393 [Galbibacter marinus]
MFQKAIKIFAIITLFVGCNLSSNKLEVQNKSVVKKKFSDVEWVKDEKFNYGDIRRYGFSGPMLNNVQIDSIFLLASKGVKVKFPSGFYNINLIIENKKNINIEFNKSVICGKISFENVENVNITGEFTALDMMFFKNSSNININGARIATNIAHNLYNEANRGVSIYSGSKNIYIKDLKILNSGGSSRRFIYNQASLLIHGFLNTPQNITIDNLLISNSKRTGAYISGRDHKFKKIVIENFGSGELNSNIKPIEKAEIGGEKKFSGLWLNLNENNIIDSLIIENNNSSLPLIKFDKSLGYIPNVIKNMSITNNRNNYLISENSNTLVLNEF